MAPGCTFIRERSLRCSCLSQLALDNARQAVLWSDADGTLLYANQASARLLGRSVAEILAIPMQSLSPAIATRVTSAGTHPFESVCLRPDGGQVPVEVSVNSFHIAGRHCHCMFLRDVSDRRHLELQLWQARATEALGKLIDDVAHDFNNLLTTVMIYSGLLLHQLDDASTLRPQVNRIVQAAEDGRALVAELLRLGRTSACKPGRKATLRQASHRRGSVAQDTPDAHGAGGHAHHRVMTITADSGKDE